MATNGSLRKKQAAILNALYYLSKDQRSAILRKADPQLVRYICECALNILRGNVPLSSKHKNKLKRHASILRKLASTQGSLSGKKKIILQKGGAFLPVLLAPILGSLISSFINR